MMRDLCTLVRCLVPVVMFASSAYADNHNASPRETFVDPMTWKKNFRNQLQEQGLYHPKAPRGFKVGLPLMQFGSSGPHLMLGYAPRLRQVDARNVTLVFVTFTLD